MDDIFVVELFSPKTILLSAIGMEVLGVFYATTTKLSNTYSSNVGSLDLYG
jgi:hypothetical protein